MKILFNITTSEDDLQRFETSKDLETLMDGFDGLELMYFGKDEKKIISKDRVVGLHMHFFPFWLDFWKGNEKRLRKEFDHRTNWENYYGGSTKEAMLQRYKKDLEYAHQYDVEYVVFHVSEATIEESFTWKYHYTDEEVVDAAAEVINEIFSEEDGNIMVLLENLWQPGLNLMRPEITKRLLDKITYANIGIMLDTGHLLHTNTGLRKQEEGIGYIHQILDEHGDLCRFIRGVHLNQSLTGEYCENIRKNPPKMAASYEERYMQMFFHAFAVDEHKPFTGAGIKELVERISPEFLTFEFITSDSKQHRQYLKEQLYALGKK